MILSACGGSDDASEEKQASIVFLADEVHPTTELYLTDINGHTIQKLNHTLFGAADVVSKRVSPSREYVAYAARDSISSVIELYVVRIDDSRAYKISGVFPLINPGVEGVYSYEWSPDSTNLAYIARNQNNNPQATLYVNQWGQTRLIIL